MDCVEAKLRIESFVAGTLAPGESGPLEEHLAACAECRLDVELSKAANRPPSAPDPAPQPMGPSPSVSASAAPKEDWTLDKIFGGGGGGGGSAKPPASMGSAPSPAPAMEASVAPAPAPQAQPTAASAPAPLELSSLAPEPAGGEWPPSNPPADGARPAAPVFPPAQPAASPMPPAPPAAAAPPALGAPPAPAPQPVAPAAPPDAEDPFEAAVAAAESIEPPSMMDGGDSDGLMSYESSDEDESPPSDVPPSWEFEPADTKSDVKPPEGSLFFAEEALARADATKGKSSAARIILWGAGGVLGLGLLGVSIWLALALRNPAPAPSIGASAPAAGTDDGAASQAGAQGVVDTVSAPSPQPAPSSGAGDGTSTGAAAPVIASNLGPNGGMPAGSTVGPGAQRPQPPKAAAPTASRTAPPAAGPVTASARSAPASGGSSPAGGGTPTAGATRAPAKIVSPSKAASGIKSSSPNTAIVLEDEADLELASPGPSSHAATPLVTAPSAPPRKAPASGTLPAADTTKPAPSSGTPEPQASDAVQRPIDRLHLATAKATENADLPALRKIRDTWKGFVKSSVGPDRARAKRELADCLWAIQTLTLRTSDQKEALAAYRDYVLNAPAGGADARTVSRMRQLEDAVAERR